MNPHRAPDKQSSASGRATLLALLCGLAALVTLLVLRTAGIGAPGAVLIALGFFALGLLPGHLERRRNRKSLQLLLDAARGTAAGAARSIPANLPAGPYRELAALLAESAALHEKTELLLRDERNRIDLILRRMVEGVAVIEADNKIVFCNEAFAQALGLSGLPRAGRLLVEVTRESGLLEIVRKVLETGETIRAEVMTGAAKRRTFAVTGAPVPTGETPSAVLVLHDISEIRRLEQMRRDFVANVSHEFKTPLTAIQGFAETLLEGALTDQRHGPRFAQIIRDHAIRLNRLTSDLLRLSLIEAGKVVIERRPCSVHEVVQACLDTVRMKAEQKGLTLLAEVPTASGEGPTVYADPARLREILLNLLDNSIQYTPSGGSVVLGARVSAEGVAFYVRDNGIGIPLAEQQRIFERFYRVDDARSREVGGTGLGLAITRHLVEAHGGTIEVSSELNRGATFTVTIPNSAAPAADESPAESDVRTGE